jgi:hypothetical protein
MTRAYLLRQVDVLLDTLDMLPRHVGELSRQLRVMGLAMKSTAQFGQMAVMFPISQSGDAARSIAFCAPIQLGGSALRPTDDAPMGAGGAA